MADRQIRKDRITEIAAAVQQFYEAHPYPRPVDSLENYRRLWQDRPRRRAEYHLLWPARAHQAERSILIAGCGTSQAAKHALRWPEAQVTGIDFSATSVRHTEALKQKYNLQNLQVHQLPLERVGELAQSFDQIVCTGVLHHLADPEAGLRALRDVLKPDGAMHLMVYAPYGRTGIYMLQEYCRRLKVIPSEEEIRDLANTLLALPQGHPLATLLADSPDFRSQAGLADALLHPQDRAYSAPQLFDLIDRAGLTFGRWLRQAPYLPQCGDLAQTPHASRLTRLRPLEQYGAVELFRGTMVRHNGIIYRNDSPFDPQPVTFAGEAWLNYVPLRMLDTICLQEQLPPGAAAVLINRTHTYPDLFLPIDSTEKRLFEAIDGKTSLGEIVEKTSATSPGKSQLEWARTFFERLWWYDQVVFDLSSQTGQGYAFSKSVKEL